MKKKKSCYPTQCNPKGRVGGKNLPPPKKKPKLLSPDLRLALEEPEEEDERMESGEKQEALLEASEDEVDSAVLNEAVDKLRPPPPPPHRELIPLSE